MSPARLAAAALAFAVLLTGCRRGGGSDARGGEGTAQQQIARGEYDQVIARLETASDAESLYLLGSAWAGKARTAPLPTPAPGAGAAGAQFKPEELRAIDAFERAIVARQELSAAHLALAELLAPHALQSLAASRGGSGPAPPSAAPGQPDATPERVLRCYGAAAQADPAGVEALEALIRFATAAGRLGDADAGYQELLRRRREDPSLLVRYGDFLAGPRAQPEAALAQYAQALMWRGDDAETRRKVAEIQLQTAASHLSRREYALAEARLADARRTGVQAGSAEEARLKELEEALRDVRGH